jgi:hypothetical protein
MSNDESRFEGDLAERDSAVLNKYTAQLAKYTLVLAIATVITMASTIWIAWSTKELRDFAEQQASDAKIQVTATNAALKAAETQALAARQANEISKSSLLSTMDTAKKQIRAYLVFDDQDFFAPLQKNMRINIYAKNVGTTPAYDVGVMPMFQFVDLPSNGDVPDFVDFEGALKSYRDTPTNPRVLGPQLKTGTNLYTPKQISDADLIGFKNGKKVLAVQAIIFYRDVYGEPHSTTFCQFQEFDRTAENGLGVSTLCSRFNKSD